MLSVLKNSAVAWQLRRTSIWKRYCQSAGRCAELRFYGGLINASEPGCIIDVGANSGSKTEIFVNLASRVIAIEPDPVSAQTLRKRFFWKPVEVCEVALSNEPGRITFYDFGAGSAFNTANGDWAACMIDGSNHMHIKLPEPSLIKVEAEILANIVEKFRPVKYVKIDAEGFEAKVLSTLYAQIPLISMEFNLPQMWDALVWCIEHLLKIDVRYRFNAAITEPPAKFELDNWATADEFVRVVRSAGWLYTEVYARIT